MFSSLGRDPPIAELEFWLAAHWAILKKLHDFIRIDGLAFYPPRNRDGTSVVESCHADIYHPGDISLP